MAGGRQQQQMKARMTLCACIDDKADEVGIIIINIYLHYCTSYHHRSFDLRLKISRQKESTMQFPFSLTSCRFCYITMVLAA